MRKDMEEDKLNKPRNFKEQVEQTLVKLLMRAEREVPDYGDFIPVHEMFPNLDTKSQNIVGMYGLTILKLPQNVRSDPKRRYIEACAYEPTGAYKAKMLVFGGCNDEILSALRDRGLVDKLCDIYATLADCLRD